MRPPRDLERSAFEGMPWPDDGHPLRIAVEVVVVVGSMSSLPSTT
jgi:hypothetical protein